MKKTVWIFLLIGMLGCKNTKNPGEEPVTEGDTIQVATEKFVLPEIPALIVQPELRHEFLIEHYWDCFDFADTAYTPSPEITEQAWVEYINLLRRTALPKAQQVIKTMILKSEQNKKLFLYFTDMAAKYLNEPNSPMRCEELYIPVLEVMTQTPVLNDTEKMLPRHRLESAYRNRAGTRAIDFRYTDRAGKTGALYRMDAEYLLLFFNEPGCPSCKEHIESIRRSAVMNQFLSERRLTILSIYAGENMEEWKKYYANYPPGWINGYDPSSTIEKRYDLRAIPTLYLLDKHKNVLLKDATFEEIENYLVRIYVM
ncbi:MAG: DUF5106 domain-containing protein [Dysgonamonadaceae bacterium]|jgi:thiol-disulfide isomerase/thioredoxin|nr:DUF5106 domain-containing protein [Dysgonamonadaceae bacterium]